MTLIYALALILAGLLNFGSYPGHVVHGHAPGVHANDTGGTMPG